MLRKKKTTIQDWNEVDNALRRMGEIEIDIGEVEGNMNLAINGLKAKANQKIAPLEEERKGLEKEVLNFTENNKEEFARARNKQLIFGKVAYRVVQGIRFLNGMETVISAMKAFGLTDFLRIKEQPDKEKMLELDDATLVKIGASREVQDKPRIELDLEKVRKAAG